jgi:Zn-finger nucleic acid-binding protein
MQCPKCYAPMNTYSRNGVQIEQCSGCRGIFLDFGELEALTRLEAQWAAPPPQAYPAAPAPAWGHHGHGYGYGHGHGHGHHGHHNKGLGHLLFSS